MARNASGHGREPTITPARTKKICEAVRTGSAFEVSARYAGVPKDTFWDWVRKGRKDGGEPVYVKFVAALDEAHAECAIARARKVTGSDDWRADAFWLERRDPANWSKTTRVEGSVQHQAVPWLDLSKLEPAEIEQLRELLAKARPDPADLPRGVDADQARTLELTAGTAA